MNAWVASVFSLGRKAWEARRAGWAFEQTKGRHCLRSDPERTVGVPGGAPAFLPAEESIQ